jgi:uncharacterized protein
MLKKKVILDTNFLLIPGQFKVDVFSEIERIMLNPYELCVVDETVSELDRIVMAAGVKDKFAAKLALVLLIQKSLKRLPCSKGLDNADDCIVSYSDENSYVATQDSELKKRVKAKGSRVIGLRQKKYLVID